MIKYKSSRDNYCAIVTLDLVSGRASLFPVLRACLTVSACPTRNNIKMNSRHCINLHIKPPPPPLQINISSRSIPIQSNPIQSMQAGSRSSIPTNSIAKSEAAPLTTKQTSSSSRKFQSAPTSLRNLLIYPARPASPALPTCLKHRITSHHHITSHPVATHRTAIVALVGHDN
jgi:hypothetical protein